MTDKELVERLNAYSAQYQNHGGITAETECFFCKYETDEGSTRCGKKDCWEWRGLEGNT